MSLWDYTTPPPFKNPKGKELVKTARGWTDPDTGEVLVAIGNLDAKGVAGIRSVHFGAASYVQGAPVSVTVHFTEKVTVTAGASIEIGWSGLAGNFTLQAAAQTAVYDVVFDKQMDNTTPEVVPSEAGTLSVASQTLLGTVVDALGATPSDLSVSASVASGAGSRVVS